MARYIHLDPHLSADDLARRYRGTKDPVERSRWHFLWLLARRLTATAIAGITGYSANWIGRIAQRYTERGPDGVKDQRRWVRSGRRLLTTAQQDALLVALGGPAPQRERWNGRTVAEWIAHSLARPVGRQLGWAYLCRLGARLRMPRLRMPRLRMPRLRMPRLRRIHADPQAQADCKQRLRPLLRAVAAAFPHATAALWALDEHRSGLKPLLRKVWPLPAYPGQRPIAPIEHRYDWRYLVGFVHPSSGRTVWHLALGDDRDH